jgi:hypothetical protein
MDDKIFTITRHFEDGEIVHITGTDGSTASFVYEDDCFVPVHVYDMKQRSRKVVEETRRQFSEWSRRPSWDRDAA